MRLKWLWVNDNKNVMNANIQCRPETSSPAHKEKTGCPNWNMSMAFIGIIIMNKYRYWHEHATYLPVSFLYDQYKTYCFFLWVIISFIDWRLPRQLVLGHSWCTVRHKRRVSMKIFSIDGSTAAHCFLFFFGYWYSYIKCHYNNEFDIEVSTSAHWWWMYFELLRWTK